MNQMNRTLIKLKELQFFTIELLRIKNNRIQKLTLQNHMNSNIQNNPENYNFR